MKNLKVMFLILLSTGFMTLQAQRFTVGANAGIPVGDAEDLTTFAIAVELGYLFDASEKIKVGPAVNYQHFFGDMQNVNGFAIEYEDEGFILVGGKGRFNIVDAFSIGTDIGYGVALSEGSDGGFYYKPHAVYDFGVVAAQLSYSAIVSDGFTLAAILLGIEVPLGL